MKAPLRRGACPALSAPMPTGDGLLIRLSPASGGFSPKQLIGLCESAARHGNGIVEVTARGSCQFRGFSAASAERFAEDVDSLAIAVRTGVPVETNPLAGMDLLEIGDAAALASLIRDGIDASGLTGRLGPKVSVVVDGEGQISLDEIVADVRLTAALVDGSVLWRVAIAGDEKTARRLGWYNDSGAVQAALSVLRKIAERGGDTRAKDVAPDLTLDHPRPFAPPSVLPDISPSRGEIGSFTSAASPGTRVIGETKAAGAISPLAGGPKDGRDPWLAPQSGRTEGGAKERDLIETGETPLSSPERTFDSGFHTFGLKGNLHALLISLAFGHIHAVSLVDLVRRAEALGVADVRPAPQRVLLLICPSIEAAQKLRDTAAALGLVTDPTDIRKNIAACPGAPACASGIIAARDIAEELARTLGVAGAQNLSIHISGCEKGCARQAAADITITGGEKGAGLVVDGTPRAIPLAYRSADGLADAIARTASLLHTTRRNGTREVSGSQKARLKSAFEQGKA